METKKSKPSVGEVSYCLGKFGYKCILESEELIKYKHLGAYIYYLPLQNKITYTEPIPRYSGRDVREELIKYIKCLRKRM